MKQLSKHKYQILVSAAAPAAVLSDRVPAYRGSGKVQEYKRILPEMRDPLQINVRLLARCINETDNRASYESGVLEINNIAITLNNGLVCFKAFKMRYKDCYELLQRLSEEDVLNCSKDTIFNIKSQYNKIWFKH